MVETEVHSSAIASGQSPGQSPPNCPYSAGKTGQCGAWVVYLGKLWWCMSRCGLPFLCHFTLVFLQATLGVQGSVCLVTS